MNHKIKKCWQGATAFSVAFLILMACSEQPITGNLSVNENGQDGLSANQINFVQWKPEIREELYKPQPLQKIGEAGKNITPQNGGVVGGNMTFGNTVEIPAGAVPANTFINVEVVCVDGHDQCGAGTDFYPDMIFLKPVRVTLSWDYIDGNPDDYGVFQVYYSEDGGITWYQLDNVEVDPINRTISIWTDHFTRYAWGLS